MSFNELLELVVHSGLKKKSSHNSDMTSSKEIQMFLEPFPCIAHVFDRFFSSFVFFWNYSNCKVLHYYFFTLHGWFSMKLNTKWLKTLTIIEWVLMIVLIEYKLESRPECPSKVLSMSVYCGLKGSPVVNINSSKANCPLT